MYGRFLSSLLDFMFIALVIYIAVKKLEIDDTEVERKGRLTYPAKRVKKSINLG